MGAHRTDGGGGLARSVRITARGFRFLLADHDARCRRCRAQAPCSIRASLSEQEREAASLEARALPVVA